MLARVLVLIVVILLLAFVGATSTDGATAGGSHIGDMVIGGGDAGENYSRFPSIGLVDFDESGPRAADPPEPAPTEEPYEIYPDDSFRIDEAAAGIPTFEYFPANNDHPALLRYASPSPLWEMTVPVGPWLQLPRGAADTLDSNIEKLKNRISSDDPRVASDPLGALVASGVTFMELRDGHLVIGESGGKYSPVSYGELPWKHVSGEQAEQLRAQLVETLTLNNWVDAPLTAPPDTGIYMRSGFYQLSFDRQTERLYWEGSPGHFEGSSGLGDIIAEIESRPTSEDPALAADSWAEVPADSMTYLRSLLAQSRFDMSAKAYLYALLENSVSFRFLEGPYTITGPERYGRVPSAEIAGVDAGTLHRAIIMSLGDFREFGEIYTPINGDLEARPESAPPPGDYQVRNSEGIVLFNYTPSTEYKAGRISIDGIDDGNFASVPELDTVLEGAIANRMEYPPKSGGNGTWEIIGAGACIAAIAVCAMIVANRRPWSSSQPSRQAVPQNLPGAPVVRVGRS